MLVEPELDATLLALDRAVAEALRARLAAGRRPGPDADAIALRALLADLGPAETTALKAVWGRIAASSTQVVAAGPAAQLLAADRWGAAVTPLAGAETALTRAAEGALAVIDLGDRPWWGRLLARPDLRIVAALPDDRAATPRAVVISRQPSGPTGDDRTFWATDSGLPAARITAALAERGLAATLLTSAGGLKLFMLAGYVQTEDGRLSDAPGSLSGVIGSAPIF